MSRIERGIPTFMSEGGDGIEGLFGKPAPKILNAEHHDAHQPIKTPEPTPFVNPLDAPFARTETVVPVAARTGVPPDSGSGSPPENPPDPPDSNAAIARQLEAIRVALEAREEANARREEALARQAQVIEANQTYLNEQINEQRQHSEQARLEAAGIIEQARLQAERMLATVGAVGVDPLSRRGMGIEGSQYQLPADPDKWQGWMRDRLAYIEPGNAQLDETTQRYIESAMASQTTPDGLAGESQRQRLREMALEFKARVALHNGAWLLDNVRTKQFAEYMMQHNVDILSIISSVECVKFVKVLFDKDPQAVFSAPKEHKIDREHGITVAEKQALIKDLAWYKADFTRQAAEKRYDELVIENGRRQPEEQLTEAQLRHQANQQAAIAVNLVEKAERVTFAASACDVPDYVKVGDYYPGPDGAPMLVKDKKGKVIKNRQGKATAIAATDKDPNVGRVRVPWRREFQVLREGDTERFWNGTELEERTLGPGERKVVWALMESDEKGEEISRPDGSEEASVVFRSTRYVATIDPDAPTTHNEVYRAAAEAGFKLQADAGAVKKGSGDYASWRLLWTGAYNVWRGRGRVVEIRDSARTGLVDFFTQQSKAVEFAPAIPKLEPNATKAQKAEYEQKYGDQIAQARRASTFGEVLLESARGNLTRVNGSAINLIKADEKINDHIWEKSDWATWLGNIAPADEVRDAFEMAGGWLTNPQWKLTHEIITKLAHIKDKFGERDPIAIDLYKAMIRYVTEPEMLAKYTRKGTRPFSPQQMENLFNYIVNQGDLPREKIAELRKYTPESAAAIRKQRFISFFGPILQALGEEITAEALFPRR